MTKSELRRRLKRRVDALTEERLLVADKLLARLEEEESIAATEELRAIPGLLEAFRKGKQEAAEGKLTPLEDIQWKE
ncbi:MAG: hypothetical protein ACLF0G_10035 [Candidatus Brocadiia bacterium]